MKAAIAPTSIDLQQVAVVLLDDEEQRRRARILLEAEHYLGDVQAVGEQIWHAAVGPDGEWLGVLVHCAAARRLAGRDRWIGWSEEPKVMSLPKGSAGVGSPWWHPTAGF